MKFAREKLNRAVSHSVLISDGGMGTLLQAKGLEPGHPPEEINLSHPQWVEEIHKSYFLAGARILTTNSFGGNRSKLSQFGLANKLLEINEKAAWLARKACNGDAFIAGSVGPTGELLYPMGSVSMAELTSIFSEQIRALKSGGVDFVILETMNDIGELIAAARACFFNDVPFISSMTFDANGRSLSGSTPEICSIVMEAYDPLAIGSNCGMGPVEMLDIAKEFVSSTHYHVIVQPNAGLPKYIDGKTVFEMSPNDFAEAGRKLAELGIAIIGGCCGTTPDHILSLRKAVENIRSGHRHRSHCMRFASRTKAVTFSDSHVFGIIGERINPTGRKKLSAQFLNHEFSMAKKDARRQLDSGAHILDVNVGVPGVDEKELMRKIVLEIQSIVPDIPLSIDSNDPDVLENGLELFTGRGLLNSINGDVSKLERLLPVVKKYGCNFIALAMDEKGIPEDSDERMKIIRRIIDYAEKNGVSRDRILVDSLVFTIGSQPQQAKETLQTIKRVKDELGCLTVLGVSNVSFGLPRRAVISSTFLAMAIEAGLNAGIINPLSTRMMETVRAADLIMNKDPGAKVYLSFIESSEDLIVKKAPYPSKKRSINIETENKTQSEIQKLITDGEKELIVKKLESEIRSGKDPESILKEEMIPAINLVGDMYGAGRIFLPQLILAGETMRKGVQFLKPLLKKNSEASFHSTPVVIGTVEGDIHDIGKNIVAIVLENQGFNVIDLGKNVTAEAFISAVREHEAKLVALSALMTTTMPMMEKTVQALKKSFSDVKVMVGGAVVTKTFAAAIQADGYAKEAASAGALALQLAQISE